MCDDCAESARGAGDDPWLCLPSCVLVCVPLVVGRSVCAGDRKVAKALQPLEVAQAFHQAG